MSDRYEIREEDDGSWSVFHVGMGLPISIDNVPMISLSMGLAQHVATELNEIEEVVRGRMEQVHPGQTYH